MNRNRAPKVPSQDASKASRAAAPLDSRSIERASGAGGSGMAAMSSQKFSNKRGQGSVGMSARDAALRLSSNALNASLGGVNQSAEFQRSDELMF